MLPEIEKLIKEGKRGMNRDEDHWRFITKLSSCEHLSAEIYGQISTMESSCDGRPGFI